MSVLETQFVATPSVVADFSNDIIQRVFKTAFTYHRNNEWFLVFKPAENVTKVEDGNDNVLLEADFVVPKKIYSIHDRLDDKHVITLLYPEEY